MDKKKWCVYESIVKKTSGAGTKSINENKTSGDTAFVAKVYDRLYDNKAKVTKLVEIELPQSLLDDWADMTDSNCHTMLRRDIAKYLAKYDEDFNIFAKFFTALEKETDGSTYQNSEFSALSLIMTHSMFKAIVATFGQEVADKINSCL